MLPMTVNSQAPEQVRLSDGQHLDVQGDPWITIQGEGPFAGHPAVFLRLAGCTLMCKQCDTDYTSKRHTETVDWVINQVLGRLESDRKLRHKRIVVLTGGEPFRQNVAPLVFALTTEHDVTVQVETNGREAPQDHPEFGDVWGRWNPNLKVVVSPKLDVDMRVWKIASAAKYVLRAGRIDATDGLPTGVLGYAKAPDRPPAGWPGKVYVQPEDDADDNLNRANREACVQSALDHGYVVSVQTHKILGVP